MGAAFLITLREGLEAAVIVSIVLTYLRQIGRQDAFRQVWLGLGAAIGVGALVGVLTYGLIGGLEGDLRRLVFAGVSLAAVAVLTWMLVWMRKQERSLSRQLQEQVDQALASGSLWGVTSVVFVAALRESLETVLFLLAVLLGTSPWELGVGGALGLVGAVALGYLIYHGGRRINLRLFFRVTGALVLVIAAGLFAKGIAWLQEAGVLPTFLWPVWNVEEVPLIGSGRVAQFLNGLLGWNPRPSIEEVGIWLLYLVVVGYFFFIIGRKPTAPTARPTATAG
jgi:high-affinity iron transporter